MVAISTFIWAVYYFTHGSTTTGGDPWESREKNLDCMAGMFDQHDFWHFLIATSLACQIYRVLLFDLQNGNVNRAYNQTPSNGTSITNGIEPLTLDGDTIVEI